MGKLLGKQCVILFLQYFRKFMLAPFFLPYCSKRKAALDFVRNKEDYDFLDL